MFNKIDMKSWGRKESYSRYYNDIPCTYSMTVNLDITALMGAIDATNYKFFPTVLHGISQTVNMHKEFRMDFDEDGGVGYYDHSNPCYTVFQSETQTIINLWTEYSPDLKTFLQSYDDDMARYKNNAHDSKPVAGKNYFNVSCIPWTSFTGFNLNLQKGYDFLPPIFTIGKYFVEGEKTFLPLAVQVHHAVCDGFHLSQFINDLQNYMDTFTK